MSADVRNYSCGLDAGDHPRAITAALKNLAGRGADLSDVLLSMRTATIEANVYHYNTAISTCQGPLWQSALHLLLRMSLHLVPADAVSQNAAMAAVGPLWQRSANLFRDSDKEGVAFNSMLSSLSKVGNWELGQSALKEMRCSLVQADHISFTACLDASGRADQWRRSWFLLKELQTSLRADVVAWNCAISSGRAWQRALEVVAAIPWHALQPDTVSYDSAISRCTGKWQHASSLMGSSGLRASLVTYHAAMTAFEAPGWCFALNFLQGIGSERLLPEVLTYNSAAAACQKALRWLQASGVLRSMSVSGLQGDSYTCSAVLGACRDSWALAVELVSGMCRSDLPPNAIVFNALASACGLAGQWQLALRSLDAVGDCFTYAAAISACEKAHEWQRALWLLYQMPGVCLKADAVCFAAAISACEKGQRWQHAIRVFSEMKTYRLEPALMACNALISALEKCSCWQLALSLLISVGMDADIVTFNAALGACAKAQPWPFALEVFDGMSGSKLQPDAVSYNVVIGACERSSHWETVLALLREESSTFGKMLADLCAPSSGTITSLMDLEFKSNSDLCHLIWRFAKLAQAALFDVDIGCVTRAAATVLAAAMRRDLDLSEISTFLWSLAVLGVDSDGPGVRRLILQLRQRLAAGQEKVLPLKLLGNVIWAVAMMKDLELLVLQKEMVARSKMDFWQTLDFSSAALEVLWASAFVQRLPIQVEASLSESVRRVAGELDRRPSPALWSPAASSGRPQLDRDSESPRILRRYSDRVVVYKPPGWQVDDALADRRWPLSSWLRTALRGQQNLLEDLQHRRGFIHRLDVPTSGLLLVGTSYSAYYDMQLQLMTRRMTRQYLVLCHGWLGARTQIEARIHSLEDGPSWYRSSRISSVGGRPSATLLEPVAYATMDEKAFTLTDFQIVTGRRHQIRVHTAHCGYPTMSDARYTAEATFKDDSSRCGRNFLHRYRLKFEVADMAQRYQEVEEQLPQDLANVLDLLEPVSAASAQGIRSSRP